MRISWIPGILLVSLVALGTIVYSQGQILMQQAASIAQLNLAVGAYTKVKNLSLQAECAKQAQQQFDRGGYNIKKQDALFSHYTDELNRCFMVMMTTGFNPDGTVSESRDVYDAFEGARYGNYIWQSIKGKPVRDTIPLMCTVKLLNGKDKGCSSIQEFDTLVESVYGIKLN